jgi:hypothetical protein
MPGRTRSLASAAPCFSEAAGWCRSILAEARAGAFWRQDEPGGVEQGAVALRRHG